MEHTYHIQPFDLRDNNNTSGRWEKWIARFDNYLVATNIKCEERKKAMLLHFAGEDVFDLYVSLPDPPDNVNTSPETSSETTQATGSSQTLKVYELAKQKLNMYFKPKLNLQFEIFKFRQAKQESSENIDQFYARLLKLSKTCNFNKPEDEIKCQIILNTTNSGLRRYALNEDEIKCQIILNTTNSGLRRYALNEQPDLEKLLTHARTMEQTDNHIKSMENTQVVICLTHARTMEQTDNHIKSMENTQVVSFTSKPQNKNKHKKVSLQVSNQKCKNCGHFAKVCLSKAAETKRKGKQSYVKDNKPRVNNTDAVEQNSDEESFNIHMYSVESTKTPRIEVIIDKTPVTCIIDSGSSVNVVSADTFYKLNDKLRLSKDNTIHMYSVESTKTPRIEVIIDKTPVTCIIDSGSSVNVIQKSTHVGTYRYKRLNFGINAAAEIFQDTVRQVLVGIAGVINVSDDILVFGKSQEEHDVALESVLERLKQSGLTLNERKCAFKKTSIHFLGFIFSDKGIAPDPKKVEAINNLDRPKNPSEVRSLLGMFNYVGYCILKE
ncbi:Reverse transcriptase (RNA-dependent DNA polymerase) [Popillia japonica]|uniref:Reverse transcriptase (RNA-dependent DNA polymerase) n=1 Tax=Popillia japonica TaxID=7064 RepID=A0AAW1N3H7_POPJA